MQEAIRVYADTSVFGGVFDTEFAKPSQRFFQEVRIGLFRLVISPLVEGELEKAPQPVRDLLGEIAVLGEEAIVTEEAVSLRRAYMEAGILGAGSSDDALHVALATVSRCDVIVSWNFRHIVHFDRIPRYNAVNTLRGYRRIEICSPSEVLHYEEEGI